MFNIIKLQTENKRLEEELAQKEITIQYLNGCVNKAMKSIDHLDFPNSNNQERENI